MVTVGHCKALIVLVNTVHSEVDNVAIGSNPCCQNCFCGLPPSLPRQHWAYFSTSWVLSQRNLG